jgi:hypothetical protein
MGFLVQSSHGGAGNFEVVVQRARGGGAFHWWRDNDDAALPWHGPSTAFGSAGDIGATSLIQSNFGAAGNLEVVATQSDQLVHSWRDDGGTWLWKTPTPLAATVAPQASPAFVQGGIGTKGNFEVVAALAGGGMGHWWRDNDDPNLAWHGPSALFGGGQIGAVALVHGLQSGNLELIARAGDQLQHWWRDPGGVWHQGPDAASGVSGRHDLCQNTFAGGPSPHYEVVAPLVAGGMGHWWADPLDPALTWHGPTPFASGQVLAVGLVQPHHGTLEVVAVFADRLEHWWRDAGGPFAWHGPSPLWQRPDFVPAVDGSCAIQYDTETVAIHAALLHTGKVVMWSFADFDDSVPQSRVLDLATGQLTTPPASHHVFCSGHAFAGDGTLVVTGGHHDDVKAVHTFSPSSDQWSHVADMAHGRWYPTAVALPDGRVLTVSGTVNGGPIAPGNPVNDSMEVIDAGGGMGGTAGLPSPWSGQFPAGLPTIDLYPFVFVLPSGQLLFHSRHVSRRYDPASGAWGPELPGVSQVSRTYPCEGSAVLLPLQPPAYTPKVLVVGGGGANPEEVALSTPSTASAEILDLGDAQPAWRSTAPMAFPRVMPDAVLLPDGSVAVVGGSATGLAGAGLSPVYPIERFDPATETWSTLCDTLAPRLYHSCALLLPDGRVLIAGKDAINNPDPFHYPDHRGEVLWPPYLFAGPPPAIGPAPGDLHYGQPFAVATPDAARVDAANLLRAGSVTHSFNMGQRLVGLEITSRSGGSISLVAPPHHHIAPPGWYLLHLLSAGVPSSGRFIHVG